MTNRAGIENHIGRMKDLHEKVKALIDKGKNIDEIKREFEENESRLIGTICNEIKKSSR